MKKIALLALITILFSCTQKSDVTPAHQPPALIGKAVFYLPYVQGLYYGQYVYISIDDHAEQQMETLEIDYVPSCDDYYSFRYSGDNNSYHTYHAETQTATKLIQWNGSFTLATDSCIAISLSL